MYKHVAEGRKVVAELRKELALAAQASGRDLVFCAAEEAVLELVQCAYDRKSAISSRISQAEEVESQMRLFAELRLIEAHIQRLVRSIPTGVPPPARLPSRRSEKAQQAINTRWQHEGA